MFIMDNDDFNDVRYFFPYNDAYIGNCDATKINTNFL